MLDLSPSLEVTGDDLRQEGERLAWLPGTWDVFVAHLGDQTTESFVQDCLRVRRFGHRPVPHLTARRYRNPERLAETLQLLSNKGAAREALILAGDVEPAGSLKDSIDVVNSGVLERGGLERVWFSVYPEGHPKISEDDLASAWKKKLEWSRSCQIPIGVVTQLAKDPETSVKWCRRQGFAEQGIGARISQFLFARPETLTGLARLAGMPVFLQVVRESGGAPYVRGPGATEGKEPPPLRAPHYMALGALGRTIAELTELFGGGGDRL
ncbi:MAG: hypothetical protein OXG03_06940 [Gammaproteobacteria bacterium]|nr:hypothetical protein [Gammaproteobacteria bacterium]